MAFSHILQIIITTRIPSCHVSSHVVCYISTIPSCTYLIKVMQKWTGNYTDQLIVQVILISVAICKIKDTFSLLSYACQMLAFYFLIVIILCTF